MRHRRMVLTPLTPVPGLWPRWCCTPTTLKIRGCTASSSPNTTRPEVVFTDDTPPRLLLEVISFEAPRLAQPAPLGRRHRRRRVRAP